MTKYQEFLDELGVISEDKFNEILDSMPKDKIDNISFTRLYYDDSCDCVSQYIIDEILDDWHCSSDNVDFENKSFELEYINSLEDLEEIKKTFSKWTITNYDESLAICKEEQEETNEFNSLLSIIETKATVEQLKEFVSQL